jgi:hypothetical protein
MPSGQRSLLNTVFFLDNCRYGNCFPGPRDSISAIVSSIGLILIEIQGVKIQVRQWLPVGMTCLPTVDCALRTLRSARQGSGLSFLILSSR